FVLRRTNATTPTTILTRPKRARHLYSARITAGSWHSRTGTIPRTSSGGMPTSPLPTPRCRPAPSPLPERQGELRLAGLPAADCLRRRLRLQRRRQVTHLLEGQQCLRQATRTLEEE